MVRKKCFKRECLSLGVVVMLRTPVFAVSGRRRQLTLSLGVDNRHTDNCFWFGSLNKAVNYQLENLVSQLLLFSSCLAVVW